MRPLKIALDWTPNSNHIGILIAKELGFYNDHGLEVNVLNPIDDDYKTTPGKKLELGMVDFAIAPFETVISLNNKNNAFASKAVFAILQEDISSIASLKSSNLDAPRFLDGKTYASYKARYEDLIVEEMIKNDGGKGKMNIIYPEKLGIWNTLLKGKADATWIFDNWEGVEAKTKQIDLNTFSLGEFGIPYGYSPVIIANSNLLIESKRDYSRFINATKQGYLFAVEHKRKSADILKKHVTAYDRANIDLYKSVKMTAPYFGSVITCGVMEEQKIKDFLSWLVKHNIEDQRIMEQKLFTNDLLL